ncbi:DUF4240 domain-containing protein [Dactylosporangium sp. NPDC049742]|uniref:DUF4240 domain-containing protein n=1 Tax=Dactylosporangium sp. NPDC049742 TaxID=3154737 RepID=UPI00344A0B8B
MSTAEVSPLSPGVDDVWRLISTARADLGGSPSSDDVAAAVVRLLRSRPAADIAAFEQPLWDLLAVSYRADLWAAAYLINGGASDDGFDYFRGWLIGQGRETFERALADPDSLATHPAVVAAAAEGEDLEGEDMLGVVWDAHRAATGGVDLPAGSCAIRYPDLDPDWEFDFDDEAEMRRRLPRLMALYDGEEER